jgi:TetR/AcrR family transcriptional regulator, transcriptional repressor for nem operon
MARPQEFETTDVLRNAMYVFWSKGYEAASLNDILAATGLSKSSLYASFGDKRELFLAAFDVYRKERLWHLHRILNDGQPARLSIENFFRQVLARAQDETRVCGCMTANEAVELAPHDAYVQKLVTEDFQAIEDAFSLAIGRGQADGSIANRQEPRILAHFLLVGLQGLEVMFRARCEPGRLDNTVSVMMAVLD